MNSKERVLTTLDHEEPDRVPLYTLSIESPDVIKGYGGSKIISLYDVDVEKSIDVFQRIGTDLCTIPVSSLPIGKSAGFGKKIPWLKTPRSSNMVDEFGRVFTFCKIEDTDLELMNYVGGYLFSESGDLEEIINKYEKWAPLDPTIKLRYVPFERGIKAAKNEGPYVVPGVQGVFEASWQPFGFENYTRLLFEHADFINEVLDDALTFFKELVEILVEKYSIELFWYWDDHGHKTGTLLNPRQFKQLIFPRIKEIVQLCHKNDVKFIHHSCGNINKILDQLIDTGIDGLNPLEPSASMDLFQVHGDHGNKITLVGNVDTIHLLAKGTPTEVEEYVKKEIKECAPGGGLIVSSSHSINPQVKFENYKAMIETTKRYGEYPISIKD